MQVSRFYLLILLFMLVCCRLLNYFYFAALHIERRDQLKCVCFLVIGLIRNILLIGEHKRKMLLAYFSVVVN